MFKPKCTVQQLIFSTKHWFQNFTTWQENSLRLQSSHKPELSATKWHRSVSEHKPHFTVGIRCKLIDGMRVQKRYTVTVLFVMMLFRCCILQVDHRKSFLVTFANSLVLWKLAYNGRFWNEHNNQLNCAAPRHRVEKSVFVGQISNCFRQLMALIVALNVLLWIIAGQQPSAWLKFLVLIIKGFCMCETFIFIPYGNWAWLKGTNFILKNHIYIFF